MTNSAAFAKPTIDEMRAALRSAAPALADEPIAFLAEGWESWAFKAGDHVLRFPKDDLPLHRLPDTCTNVEALRLERRLLPELARHLSTTVPVQDVFSEMGPNGAPFAGHGWLPGEIVMRASRAPGAGFGRDFGRLLAELWSFPIERAVDLGVPLIDGAHLRAERGRHYEDVIRRAFPLVSCEVRIRIEQVYEGYLNDATSFVFEPRLVHQDLEENTLIDSATGELCGLIDFGGTVMSSRAIDLWLPVFGFPRLGIEDQVGACLEAAGIDEGELKSMMHEVAFREFHFALLDILHGLDLGDDELVAEAIRQLTANLPPDIVCS